MIVTQSCSSIGICNIWQVTILFLHSSCKRITIYISSGFFFSPIHIRMYCILSIDTYIFHKWDHEVGDSSVLKFYWGTADSQCCHNFCCMTQWFSSILSHLGSDSSPVQVITKHWVEFPICAAGVCWPSFPCVVVCTCQSQTPSPSSPHLSPW